MKKFYRYQYTSLFETRPSWHGYGQVVIDRPADQNGYPGYYWAWVIDPATERPVYEEDYLVQEKDVPAAQAGEEVDYYLPGLCGCESAEALLTYIEEQCGGVDSDMYVAVYEGEKVMEVWDGVVFVPSRLLKIYPADEFCKLAEAEEE